MSSNIFSSQITTQLGPVVLGGYFAILVYGTTIMQVIYYFAVYPKDYRLLKILVSFIFALDSVQLFVLLLAIFEASVKDWGNPLSLVIGSEGDHFIRLLAAHTIPTDIIAPAVQVFWLWRIWHLGKDTLLQRRFTRVLVFGSLIIMVSSEFASMLVFSIPATIWALRPIQLELQMSVATTILLVTDFAFSVVITLVLYRSRSGHQGTNKILKNLILYVVANGSLTTVFVSAHLFLFLRNPEDFSWMSVLFVYERLIVSSLLASLNIRTALRPVAKLVLPIAIHGDSPSSLIGHMNKEIEDDEKSMSPRAY